MYRGTEFWLTNPDMAARLQAIDARIATTPPADIPALWESIPFDVFSLLAFQRPAAYPNLQRFFPEWPPAEVQESTVGASGFKLQLMTNAFIRSLVAGAERHLAKPLREARVLDYGVGFGRNLRMLSKFVPASQLFGVDPFLPHIETCRQIGLKAEVHACATVPEALPAPIADRPFDLVFLFSIFTHLSEKTHKRVLAVIHQHLADDGLLALTVRPGESWHVVVPPDQVDAYRRRHDEHGFAFLPVEIFAKVEGDTTFGETSISLDYIRREWTDWKIVGLDLNLVDPYQLIVFLRKA